jgi:hypothetical protein
MAADTRFRKPSEMTKDEKRTPVSTRLKLSTKEILEREAKKTGIPLAMLVSNILDDYVAWLTAKGK